MWKWCENLTWEKRAANWHVTWKALFKCRVKQKFYPSFNQLPEQKLKHQHEVDDRSGYIFKILLKRLHQVLSICVHYNVILVVKKKNVPFIYWQCVTLLNSTWYEIFIQNGANVFYTNFSLFKSDEGRWTTSNATNCKQDGVFFNEWLPWLKPRCVRPDHHASR